MIVKCKTKIDGKTDCPMLKLCFARMVDPTISGCGLPLYLAGIIKCKQDIQVEHTVYTGSDNETDRHRGKHRK